MYLHGTCHSFKVEYWAGKGKIKYYEASVMKWNAVQRMSSVFWSCCSVTTQKNDENPASFQLLLHALWPNCSCGNQFFLALFTAVMTLKFLTEYTSLWIPIDKLISQRYIRSIFIIRRLEKLLHQSKESSYAYIQFIIDKLCLSCFVRYWWCQLHCSPAEKCWGWVSKHRLLSIA